LGGGVWTQAWSSTADDAAIQKARVREVEFSIDFMKKILRATLLTVQNPRRGKGLVQPDIRQAALLSPHISPGTRPCGGAWASRGG
jgi:hypothetical protein